MKGKEQYANDQGTLMDGRGDWGDEGEGYYIKTQEKRNDF